MTKSLEELLSDTFTAGAAAAEYTGDPTHTYDQYHPEFPLGMSLDFITPPGADPLEFMKTLFGGANKTFLLHDPDGREITVRLYLYGDNVRPECITPFGD